MSIARFDTVLINGSVGTGKTSAAEAVGEALQRCGVSGAVIDVDWLSRFWPAPEDDPFRTALALENLQAITANFRRAGAAVVVVATVMETPDQLQRTTVALGSPRPLHVRLTLDPDVARSRLAGRHGDDEAALSWHTRRHPELAGVLERAGFTDDMRIDTTHKRPREVAREILSAIIAGP